MAPPDDIHESAYQRVLNSLSEMHRAWTAHRESINRAVVLIDNDVHRLELMIRQEVIDRKAQFEKDEADRVKRQAALDSTLQTIQDNQRHRRIFDWIHVGIELLLLALIAAYVIGRIS